MLSNLVIKGLKLLVFRKDLTRGNFIVELVKEQIWGWCSKGRVTLEEKTVLLFSLWPQFFQLRLLARVEGTRPRKDRLEWIISAFYLCTFQLRMLLLDITRHFSITIWFFLSEQNFNITGITWTSNFLLRFLFQENWVLYARI